MIRNTDMRENKRASVWRTEHAKLLWGFSTTKPFGPMMLKPTPTISVAASFFDHKGYPSVHHSPPKQKNTAGHSLGGDVTDGAGALGKTLVSVVNAKRNGLKHHSPPRQLH